MGAYKAYLIEQQEIADMNAEFEEYEYYLEPEPNEYEAALLTGEKLLGKNNSFVMSCWDFYKKNKFLSDAQIYRLENPKFRKKY